MGSSENRNMKTFGLFAISASALSSKELFDQWKSNFGVKYQSPREEALRFDQWMKNKDSKKNIFEKMRLAFILSVLALNVSAANWFGLAAKQLLAGAPEVDKAYADALIEHMQMMEAAKNDEMEVTQPMPKGKE